MEVSTHKKRMTAGLAARILLPNSPAQERRRRYYLAKIAANQYLKQTACYQGPANDAGDGKIIPKITASVNFSLNVQIRTQYKTTY